MKVPALAVLSPRSAPVPFTSELRPVGRRDVLLEVPYCGLCHADLDRLGSTEGRYPVVPGHEIVGRVVEVGRRVRGLEVGELAAAGWVTRACGRCQACRDGHAAGCDEASEPGLGGYATHAVVDERFVFRVRDGLVPALLCSGSVLYTLFRGCKTLPGDRVAVLGNGVVADLASKLAAALGAAVDRVELAHLAAIEGGDRAWASGFDVVVSAEVDPPSDLADQRQHVASLLRRPGSILLCDEPLYPPVVGLSVEWGEQTAGMAVTVCRPEQTQEMLDLCANAGVTVDVELVSFADIVDAHERLEREPGRRMVAELATLPAR